MVTEILKNYIPAQPGKIVDMGSHDKLIKSSTIYQEVYNSQNHIGGNNGKKDKK